MDRLPNDAHPGYADRERESVSSRRREANRQTMGASTDITRVPVPACQNCDRALNPEWRYCAYCGQKAAVPRLTLHEIGYETLHALFHVDRSVLSLIRALALRPGRVALEYVSGRRKRYYGPFAFLIVSVAITAAAISITEFPAVTSDAPSAVARFLQHHVNLLFFSQVPLIAAALRLLSPRGPFNYAEYLVLAAYVAGMRILLFAVVNVGGWYLFKPSVPLARDIYFALMPVMPLYLGFACTQFLPGPKWLAALKGAAAWAIGYALSQGVVLAIGNLVDRVK
jgi:hypothetical protein